VSANVPMCFGSVNETPSNYPIYRYHPVFADLTHHCEVIGLGYPEPALHLGSLFS